MKRRDRLWWAAGGLALAVLAAVFAVHALFEPGRLKALAIERVKAAWSRELGIGDLSLQLRPFPALHATGVTLSNPAWAHERHLLEADSLTARLELMPLLGGKLVVKTLSIDGLKANLETGPDGRRSWDLRADAPRAQPAGDEAFDPRLITSVRLRNAQLLLRSGAQQPDLWTVDDFDAHGHRGWRDVRIETRITRNGQRLEASADLDNLSQAGVKGVVSEGSADLRWDKARLRLTGRLPLEAGLGNTAARAELDAESLTAVLGFFGLKAGATAPLKASADLRAAEGGMAFHGLNLAFGKLAAKGDASVRKPASRWRVEARLATARLDWAQFIADIGKPPPPPKPPGELFHAHPLPWPLLASMDGIDARFDVQVASLILRSGIEARNVKATIAVKDTQANVAPFSFNVFGGTARGSMQVDGGRKRIRLALDAERVQLGAWLEAKGKKGVLGGGPMKIDADVAMAGASMKELAASLTGPVTIRVGSAKVYSKKLQDAENLLVGLAPVFSAQGAEQVELVCAGARLPFSQGRAVAQPIAGARSEASQLLTSGYVDLRQQTLDLHGRVRARNGISLGMTNLSGDVRIAGRLMHPEVGMDPDGAIEAMARVGAAVLTSGVSLLATAAWDAAVPESDACNAVFKGQPDPAAVPKKKAKPGRR